MKSVLEASAKSLSFSLLSELEGERETPTERLKRDEWVKVLRVKEEDGWIDEWR